MKNLITIALVVLLAVLCLDLNHDNQRLRTNTHALQEGITLYKTKAERSAASVEVLTLELGEFKELHKADRATIDDMGIRLRRMESYAKSVTATTLRDTVIMRDTVILRDSVLYAHHTTPWTTLHATISNDTLSYQIINYDTLHQVIHRVPRKFLCFRFGTKAIRQEVTCSNPNTRLIYTEYIELE
jgi:hypothetical protein